MKLKEKRTQKGFTQRQLDKKSGVSTAVISAIETGRIKNPSWDIVYRLSKALETPPEELFPVEDIAA